MFSIKSIQRRPITLGEDRHEQTNIGQHELKQKLERSGFKEISK
jgi:hypothetical protein